MKKEYTTPELELIMLTVSHDVLALSDPEQTDAGGGYTPSNPDDPFGDL